jgi:hypothetical protein
MKLFYFKTTYRPIIALALIASILFFPACKGCSGDDEPQGNSADSSSDVATDTVAKIKNTRKNRRRMKRDERPERRRVETPPIKKERAEPVDAKQKDAPLKSSTPAEQGKDLASKEPAPQLVKIQALQIRDFVQTAELVKLLNQSNGMVEAPLRGQDITSDYNHLRLVSIGQKDHLGLIVQVWRDSSVPEARQRHEEFIKSFPSAKPNQSVTRKTFFAQYGLRSYAGFLATGQRTNVVLTCNSDLCSPDQLHKVAMAIKMRLVRK